MGQKNSKNDKRVVNPQPVVVANEKLADSKCANGLSSPYAAPAYGLNFVNTVQLSSDNDSVSRSNYRMAEENLKNEKKDKMRESTGTGTTLAKKNPYVTKISSPVRTLSPDNDDAFRRRIVENALGNTEGKKLRKPEVSYKTFPETTNQEKQYSSPYAALSKTFQNVNQSEGISSQNVSEKQYSSPYAALSKTLQNVNQSEGISSRNVSERALRNSTPEKGRPYVPPVVTTDKPLQTNKTGFLDLSSCNTFSSSTLKNWNQEPIHKPQHSIQIMWNVNQCEGISSQNVSGIALRNSTPEKGRPYVPPVVTTDKPLQTNKTGMLDMSSCNTFSSSTFKNWNQEPIHKPEQSTQVMWINEHFTSECREQELKPLFSVKSVDFEPRTKDNSLETRRHGEQISERRKKQQSLLRKVDEAYGPGSDSTGSKSQMIRPWSEQNPVRPPPRSNFSDHNQKQFQDVEKETPPRSEDTRSYISQANDIDEPLLGSIGRGRGRGRRRVRGRGQARQKQEPQYSGISTVKNEDLKTQTPLSNVNSNPKKCKEQYENCSNNNNTRNQPVNMEKKIPMFHPRVRDNHNEISGMKTHNDVSEENYRPLPAHKNEEGNRDRHPRNPKPPLPRFDNAKPMGLKLLQDSLCKPPNQILFFLKTDRGFRKLLEQKHISPVTLSCIWTAIAVCCRSDQKANLTDFLTTVNSLTDFSVHKLQHFLLTVQVSKCHADDVKTLSNIMTFLETLYLLHPSVILPTVNLVLPILKETVDLKKNVLGPALLNRLKLLEESRTSLRDRYNIPGIKDVGKSATEPTDNFRDIPVVPDRNDILSNVRPFLRQNIVSGSYIDVDHYLDVQFRLLREDFVRPLREGIATYQKYVNAGKHIRLQDINVYLNVRVVKSRISEKGIGHEIAFPMVGALTRINWEHSKRLLYGSLLCFTTDNFESFFCATITERDPQLIRKGKLSVKFENKFFIENSNGVKYTMFEPTAYFEAYRHVLTALQEMSSEHFPLVEYIVKVQKNVNPPKYVNNENQVYCFGDVLKPIYHPKYYSNSKCVFARVNQTNCNGKAIPILNELEWRNLKFDLDDSQKQAIKCCLTKSLAVIQGPPGTGKTFVGLKVVEMFLHNRHVWCPPEDPCPILIVCYTNHALDQFLEGILKTTQNIVRIGGRSRSEVMSEYNLTELRRRLARHQDYTLRARLQIEAKIKELSHQIAEADKKPETWQEVLGFIEEYIPEVHWKSLSIHCPAYLSSVDVYTRLGAWLDVRELPGRSIPQAIGAGYMAAGSTPNFEMSVQGKGKNQKVKINSNGSGVGRNDDLGMIDLDYIRELEEQNLDDNALNFDDLSACGEELEDAFTEENFHFACGFQEGRYTFQSLCRSCMTHAEADKCDNVWSLEPEDRRRLFGLWLKCVNDMLEEEVLSCSEELEKCILLLQEIREERDKVIASNAHVVGLTTTGAAKFRNVIRKMKPRIVVVEEAAEVLEAHIITALSEYTEHLILIGDHQQLRPNPTVYELVTKYNLDISLFERMIKNGVPYCRLSVQHRMRPCISKLLVPHIYEDLKDHPHVHRYENVLGMDKNMYFLSHTEYEYQSEIKDGMSKVNIFEIDFLVELCRYLLLQGYQPSQITILTTYLAQCQRLKKKMVESLQQVKVTTVDNYQGEENDIILLSFVRSNEKGSIGFLKASNRVCVALSRAKKGLYCIGNFGLLAEKSSLFDDIVQDLRDRDAIGPALKIKCQNHGNVVPMTTAADFFKIPDGGCLEPCDYRLPCGHVCARQCHPDDRDHDGYKCKKKCLKVLCQLNHTCQKLCWKACGVCNVLVNKTIASCKHQILVPCHQDPIRSLCNLACENILQCGHRCLKTCGSTCGECTVLVNVASPCGHKVKVQCHQSKVKELVLASCKDKCSKLLFCGHKCKNRCGEKCISCCVADTQHVLDCGHEIKAPCFRVKLEKTMRWENTCNACQHQILKKSFDNLSLTSLPVKHQDVSEEDLQDKCKVACRAELECGHLCKGSCGECYEGRIHAVCKEICGKMLVCGHLCHYPCSRNCSSCSRKCENRCVHSRCQRLCGIPCTPCTEPCAWNCEHFSCNRLCHEPCDRPPCDKPCLKKLKCGHQCIGMCGEPCPKICRNCHKEEVTEIFFGSEDEPEARFIFLEDCRHIFELEGFTRWIETQNDIQLGSEINMIVCPKCKTPLRKNLRFNAAVKKRLELIEKVKLKFYGAEKNNAVLLKQLLGRLDKPFAYQKSKQESVRDSTDPCSVLEAISSYVASLRTVPDVNTLTLYSNYLSFAEENQNVVLKIREIPRNVSEYANETFDRTRNYIGRSLRVINAQIMTNLLRGSSQLVNDIVWEMRRLKLIANFVVAFQNVLGVRAGPTPRKITEVMKLLLSRTPFRNRHEITILDLENQIRKLCYGIAIIGLTDMERLSILRAMGLRQGHWYQCPNGHVYVVTECGGPMEEGQCNECGVTIGGRNHQLKSGNKVATAMDGATSPACSYQFH